MLRRKKSGTHSKIDKQLYAHALNVATGGELAPES